MFFAKVLKSTATRVAKISPNGCFFLFADEPKCPKSLIK